MIFANGSELFLLLFRFFKQIDDFFVLLHCKFKGDPRAAFRLVACQCVL